MMPKRPFEPVFHFQKLLGQQIAKTVPFLKETACMNLEERRKYAILRIIELWVPNSSEKVKEIFKKLKETLEFLGYANWMRTEITHLALKTGVKASSESLGDPWEKDTESLNPQT